MSGFMVDSQPREPRDSLIEKLKKRTANAAAIKEDIDETPENFWSSNCTSSIKFMGNRINMQLSTQQSLLPQREPENLKEFASTSAQDSDVETLTRLQETPKKRYGDRFDILKSSTSYHIKGSCTPTPCSPKRRAESDDEDFSEVQDKSEKKRVYICPLHTGPTLFEEAPVIKCDYDCCVYYPHKIQTPKKSRRKQNLSGEGRKSKYGPLKMVSDGSRRPKETITLDNGRSSGQTKTPSSISAKSFYSKSRRNSEPSKENRSVSPLPDLISIEDMDRTLPLLSPSPRTRTPILTRNRSITKGDASSQLLLPYEIGFENLGNTCYVNATMQVLLALPGFMDDFSSAFEKPEDLPVWLYLITKVASARKRGFVQEVNGINNDFINSLDTLHPCYGNQDQQDANEFLVRVMEQMHSALPTGPTNPVEIHFQCEVVEIRHCPKCDVQVKRSENHTSICLPILENSHNLEQCLEDYTAEEERSITCAKCQATSMMVCSRFRTLPKKLIMSINRYSKEEKVMQPIIPPEELDIQRFMESPNDHEPSRYALAAQIIHRGDSKHSGHYVSHVLCEDGLWRCYNDTYVRTISLEGDIQNVDGDPAYIYFYVLKPSICQNKNVEV